MGDVKRMRSYLFWALERDNSYQAVARHVEGVNVSPLIAFKKLQEFRRENPEFAHILKQLISGNQYKARKKALYNGGNN